MSLETKQLLGGIKKLIVALFVLLMLASFISCMLNQLGTPQLLEAMATVALLSPIAYLLYRAQHPLGQRPRHGAERTPLLPPDEEEA